MSDVIDELVSGRDMFGDRYVGDKKSSSCQYAACGGCIELEVMLSWDVSKCVGALIERDGFCRGGTGPDAAISWTRAPCPVSVVDSVLRGHCCGIGER